MKTSGAAFWKCLAIKSVMKPPEALTAGAWVREPGRGQGSRTGRPPARSPQGLPEGAIWDFSEGHWDHILVS